MVDQATSAGSLETNASEENGKVPNEMMVIVMIIQIYYYYF